MSTSQSIGSLIRTRRIKNKMTQKQLAVKIFEDESRHYSIYRLENGKNQNIHFDTVCSALEALGIDLIKLIKTQI
jgi:transcriptional regulator with XRE-family HTH domain